MSSTRGFASLSPAQRRYVSAKGGRKAIPKGLARMSPEKRQEIQRLGGLKRQDNLRKEKEQNGKDSIPSGNEG